MIPKGDGITDDTQALQEMVDALHDGDILTLSPGTYLVSGTIRISTSNLVIKGNKAKIKQITPNTKSVLLDGVKGVEIFGIDFEGVGTELKATSTSFNGVAAIYIKDCNDISIHHNSLKNHAGGGIRWTGFCNNINISINNIVGIGLIGGIKSGDNGNDIAIGSYMANSNTAITIHNNTISGHCFGIFLNDSNGAVISDNHIYDCPGQHGMYISSTSNIIIGNNVVKNVEYIGIKCQISTLDSTIHNVTIDNNTITDCNQSGVSINVTAGNTTSKFENLRITNNSISDMINYGIHVKQIEKGYISNNTILNTKAFGILSQSYSGVILNNLVRETGWSSIYASLRDFTIIKDNNIQDSVQNYNNEIVSSRVKHSIQIFKDAISNVPNIKCLLQNNIFYNYLNDPLYYTNNTSINNDTTVDYLDNIDYTGKNYTLVGNGTIGGL